MIFKLLKTKDKVRKTTTEKRNIAYKKKNKRKLQQDSQTIREVSDIFTLLKEKPPNCQTNILHTAQVPFKNEG